MVGGVVLLTLVLYVLPSLLVGPDDQLTAAERLKAESDVRNTLIQALGGAALLAGLYFTARTFQVNREAQATERLTRAVAQLGDDKLDIRLGGIFSLERIGQGSNADHWPVVQVLTAFVREHAPWPPTDSSAPEDRRRGSRASLHGVYDIFVPDPPADVQAAMTVLGRRNREHEEADQRLNLQGVDLRGFDLAGAHLERANLHGSQLAKASLERAFLDGADVQGVDFTGARLGGARLVGVFMNAVLLDGADLIDADLEGATFQQSSLRGAFFSSRPLGNVTISHQDMRDAGLTVWHLDGAVIHAESVKLPPVDGADVRVEEDLGSGRIRLAVMDPSGRRPRDW